MSTGIVFGCLSWFTLLNLLVFPSVQSIRLPIAPDHIGGKLTSTLSCMEKLPQLQLYGFLQIRGGGAFQEEESDDESCVEVTPEEDAGSIAVQISRLTFSVVGGLLKTSSRIITAIFESDDAKNEDEDVGIIAKIQQTVQRMFRAAFSPDVARDSQESGSDDRDVSEDEGASLESEGGKHASDFGSFLAKSYGVDASRELLDDVTPILGGTINDALRVARSQSRLLLVFIPSARPGKGKKFGDNEAMESFLSKEVALLADKRARKKETSGSFLLWGARAGSPEAVVAAKRLKAQQQNNKGQKRPILLVAYPAQVVDNRGQTQISPKLLAQHHCSPPPSPKTMRTWLNALRKRHAKQYASMQLQAKEAQYFKDRKAGYKDSLQVDKDREEREVHEKAERIAREKAEKKRRAEVAKRREGLRESLPDEPDKEEPGTKTVSLRLADGTSAQRRFSGEDKLADVFNWADVTFELERELIQMTTMNGKNMYDWEEDSETSLNSSGLGKMAGLRITEKKMSEEKEGDTP